MNNIKWKKSSHSNANGDCVEVADNLPRIVPIRDSKRTDGPVLRVQRSAYSSLLRHLK